QLSLTQSDEPTNKQQSGLYFFASKNPAFHFLPNGLFSCSTNKPPSLSTNTRSSLVSPTQITLNTPFFLYNLLIVCLSNGKRPFIGITAIHLTAFFLKYKSSSIEIK